MEIIILGVLAIIWLIYSIAKDYQLYKFSQYMCEVATYESINFYRSYREAEKSPAWDHNFKRMLIYEV
jgi:hypothetical protein